MKAKNLLLVMILALCSCHSSEPNTSCDDINAATAHLQLEMSMQMLRLEVLRDEVEDRGNDAVSKCDPQISAPIYASVNAGLQALAACMVDGEDRSNLNGITLAWKQLQERHDSVWRESQDVSSLEPRERCIRASAVAASRIAIERNWEKIRARSRGSKS